MKRVVLCLALCCTGLMASSAWADVVPPDVAKCDTKAKGDSCQTEANESGTCQASKCSRVLPPQNGEPSKTEEYDCVRCVVSSAGTEPGGSDAGSVADQVSVADTGSVQSGCDAAGGGFRFGFALLLIFFGLFAAWRVGRKPVEQRVKVRRSR